MFVYALAKGVRKHYLGHQYLPVAQKGYREALSNASSRLNRAEKMNLEGTVSVRRARREPISRREL